MMVTELAGIDRQDIDTRLRSLWRQAAFFVWVCLHGHGHHQVPLKFRSSTQMTFKFPLLRSLRSMALGASFVAAMAVTPTVASAQTVTAVFP